jgi:hypothetical protein
MKSLAALPTLHSSQTPTLVVHYDAADAHDAVERLRNLDAALYRFAHSS